ncbi:MAG: hypothetical protein WAS27_01055 [Candidatus Saccharimonadales bacterium]
MLIVGSDIINTPILSLQTGRELAHITRAVINPHDLSVISYEVDGVHLDTHPSYLRTSDVRELSRIGFIVNSSDEFLEDDDIIKFKDIYELAFDLAGKPVLDEGRHAIGKVTDYTVEAESFVIQQLIVKRPLLKRFNDSELLIHRSQVIEITNDAIVITARAEDTSALTQPASQSFINPFRQAPQTESTRKQSV